MPEDLSQDNLSTWADTVQDVAARVIAPQPGTSQIIFPQVVEVLTLLESVSRVAFCRQCYLPGSACRCLGSCSTTSTASTAGPSWSDIADPTFGTNSASAGRGAGSALPYGSSASLPHRCLISHAPPSRLRDVLVERLNLNSRGLLTGTRWLSFQPTVAGVGKKTWTFI